MLSLLANEVRRALDVANIPLIDFVEEVRDSKYEDHEYIRRRCQERYGRITAEDIVPNAAKSEAEGEVAKKHAAEQAGLSSLPRTSNVSQDASRIASATSPTGGVCRAGGCRVEVFGQALLGGGNALAIAGDGGACLRRDPTTGRTPCLGIPSGERRLALCGVRFLQPFIETCPELLESGAQRHRPSRVRVENIYVQSLVVGTVTPRNTFQSRSRGVRVLTQSRSPRRPSLIRFP